jgi:hypothetical protein
LQILKPETIPGWHPASAGVRKDLQRIKKDRLTLPTPREGR